MYSLKYAFPIMIHSVVEVPIKFMVVYMDITGKRAITVELDKC